MKKNYILILLGALVSINLSATTYTSTANGNWMSFTTWSPFGVPIPGDIVIINHAVALDTSFAYSTGSISVNSSGSLIQNSPVRDIWVNGVNASFTNNGTTTIRYLLLSAGSFTNSGTFNVKAFENHITAANTVTGVLNGVDSLYNLGTLNNNGTIKVVAFYNISTLNNYGTIKGLLTVVDSMVNSGNFLNDASALLQADSCTNYGSFTNNGVVNFNQFTNEGTLTNANTLTFDDITNLGTFTNQGNLTGTNSMWNVEIFNNATAGQITIGNGFLNVDSVNNTASFNNDGTFDIGDSFYNFNEITGSSTGSFTVQDTSYNSGTMAGSFDFCDATPPPTSPYIDIILGSVDPAITYCTVGININNNITVTKIYPNPTNGFINIISDKDVIVEVYDVLGEKLMTTNNKQIDLTSYQDGIYLVLLKDETGNLMRQKRLVKQ